MKTQNYNTTGNNKGTTKIGANSASDTGMRPISNRDIHDLKKALRMSHSIPTIGTQANIIAAFFVYYERTNIMQVYSVIAKHIRKGVTYIECIVDDLHREILPFNGTTTISDCLKKGIISVETSLVKSNETIWNLSIEEYEAQQPTTINAVNYDDYDNYYEAMMNESGYGVCDDDYEGYDDDDHIEMICDNEDYDINEVMNDIDKYMK